VEDSVSSGRPGAQPSSDERPGAGSSPNAGAPGDTQPHANPSSDEHPLEPRDGVDDAESAPEPTPVSTSLDVDDQPNEDLARAKRRRPESLVELYTVPKAAAPDLLTGLAKHEAWITSSADQEQALGLLSERDPDLAKTRTLAQHVATSHDGRFAASFESFIVRAVAPVLEGTPRWPPQNGDDGPTLFAALLDHHAAALGEKEPPRRLFNAVMIAQSILMARYRLDIQDAVPLLSRTLGVPAALRRERRNPRVVRLRSLGDTRLTVDSLRTWLDVLTPWIERALEAERTAEKAAVDVERLKGIVDRLEHELADAHRENERANAEIAKLRQEIDELSDQKRGATLARRHEGSQLRSSMAGFLEDELLVLLSAVREGLELNPPRVPFALERLEDADHAARTKVQWLRSSD